MRIKTFEYVPSFDMDTAIFDNHREFYNSYRRKKECPAGSTAIGLLADGNVNAAWSTGAARSCPFTHYTTGEVLVDKCDDPEKRGRYTFGDYDFSVISTTNDRYGAIAMRHMYALGSDFEHLKINATALSMASSGESKSGQTLLIDHKTERVYSLARNYHPDTTTSDGVDLGKNWEAIPEKRRKEGPCVYFYEAGTVARPSAAIRVTHLDRRDTTYRDTLAACVAWFQMEGRTVLDYRHDEMKVKGQYNVMSIHSCVERHVVEKGFTALTDYERARVATVNASKPMPRKQYALFTLGFDNEGFFKEVNEKINK